MPVISAAQKDVGRRIAVQSQPSAKRETLFGKIT
jgi:hypothetical protein